MKFLPKPKEVKLLTGEHALCYDGRIVLDGRLLGNGDTYAKVLQKGIKKETGMQYDIGYGVPGRKETGAIVLELDETRKSQQYVLQVTEEEIRIQGGDGAGVLYGVQTLCQMMHEYGALLPAVRIEDEPDLPVRGYYLDETRGRVLTLSYLKQVADRMAYYKLNQLQLYVEHTYLFSGLSEMWRDETPLTAEEIRELDAYCAKLHIELVPSIATFGHLYMLLSTKSYGDLCEFPDSWKEPFSFWDRMQHHTVDVSGGTGTSSVSLSSTSDGTLDGDPAATKMNVVIPTILPIAVGTDGTVTTATDIRITNNSFGAVKVDNVKVEAGTGWKLTAFGSKDSLAKVKVDSNMIGFKLALGGGAEQLTNAENAASQTLIDGAIEGCYMSGNGDQTANSIGIAYNAIVSPVSEAVVNASVASVLFVICWDAV